MAQTQGAALEGQLPIGLHLRCCSRYYYTADTKSPILNQGAALFLNRRGVRENIRRIKRHHHPGHRKQRGGQIHAMQSRMTHHHQ